MNERIKELLIESKFPLYELYGREMDKFAELIVRECLDVVALRLYLGTEEICRQECKALASDIKEYFGVEE